MWVFTRGTPGEAVRRPLTSTAVQTVRGETERAQQVPFLYQL